VNTNPAAGDRHAERRDRLAGQADKVGDLERNLVGAVRRPARRASVPRGDLIDKRRAPTTVASGYKR